MSGGVDSSVAAAILQKRGYEVIGLSAKFWGRDNLCCSEPDLRDARQVAQQLDIEHHTISLEKIFKKKVVDYFVSEYLKGRTPNPCVVCNRFIKFGALLEIADEFKAGFLATGHYAIVEKSEKSKTMVLKRAREKNKDQSYFLARITQNSLQRALFPLGNYGKGAIRELARNYNLPVHEKKESQEVCFIPDGDVASFINTQAGNGCTAKGHIIDQAGQILGSHPGIYRFTIGQRKGLGIATGKPIYVTGIEADSRTVVVGEGKHLFKTSFRAKDLLWINRKAVKKSLRCKVKIRYKHHPQGATVNFEKNNRIKVTFDQAQRAITPGQLAVFYDEDRVMGSAWIDYVME